ncbi:MAG TPA: DUF2914 domain-containing protein [Blastocatellia bacterium]|nr:DUF2914 domain-containing protein [Blastocatellia bacterium]
MRRGAQGEKARGRRAADDSLSRRLRQWYERYGPVAGFVIGFVYDTLTLTRIDRLVDNLILLGYAVAAGVLITLVGLSERGRPLPAWLGRNQNLLTSATHFFLGGMLSSFVVFYFKSAGVGQSFVFVVLLIGLMLANEFFADRLHNLKLLIGLYYFCWFAFLTFFVPVVTHVMGTGVFLASGIASFVPPAAILGIIYRGRRHRLWPEVMPVASIPLVVFLTVTVFYFLNWIPPVPLALKEGGIYRSVRRVGDRYEVRYQKPPWWRFWRQDERDFAYRPGDAVYCFAAVFAPTAFREEVVHHWQRRDRTGEWITTDVLTYSVVGGREGGYRGYTVKRNITPGSWRVDVRTLSGRLLGRISFEVVAGGPSRPLLTAFR